MAKLIAPGGVALLGAEESAVLLDVRMHQFRHLEKCGFIQPVGTPLGPRYREDLIRDLAEALAPVVEKQNRIRPGEAAAILGVTSRTVSNHVAAGRLHRDPQGLYDAAEVRALARARGKRV